MARGASTHPSVVIATPAARAAPPPPKPPPELPDLAEVVRQHGPYVWRTLRYLGVAAADLEDACQEVFLVAFRRLPEFEQRSSLSTWLYGICARVAAAQRRRAHRYRETLTEQPPDLPVEPLVGEHIDEARAREHLRRVLGELDPAKREVFVLYEIERRSMAEIAEALGCPLRTAYSRLEAARKEVLSKWRRLQIGRDP